MVGYIFLVQLELPTWLNVHRNNIHLQKSFKQAVLFARYSYKKKEPIGPLVEKLGKYGWETGKKSRKKPQVNRKKKLFVEIHLPFPPHWGRPPSTPQPPTDTIATVGPPFFLNQDPMHNTRPRINTIKGHTKKSANKNEYRVLKKGEGCTGEKHRVIYSTIMGLLLYYFLVYYIFIFVLIFLLLSFECRVNVLFGAWTWHTCIYMLVTEDCQR